MIYPVLVNVLLGLQGKVYPFFHVLALVDGVWSIRNWNQVLGCM